VLNSTGHVEPHIKESNHIRDFVFGIGDGRNTALGIVAGVRGANSSADFIILAPLVAMFTGAKAMAVQDYLAGTGIELFGYGIGVKLNNANLLNY
jgi:hypothetical protein